ncbi:hypothetical protein [[Micrococcus luteus] ATCC 49442]|uniref:hypothetical protein n=1 Tax=[Micrococcus luteus] ATCC 49442 TaxID=2698727 RepID=UPI0013DA2620|nr:hypothetical protein [[Micrococcus luteus] ATCC 49442]
MTSHSTFISRNEHYAKNYKMGESIRVSPAKLQHHEGSTPGVAIFTDRSYPAVVLTEEHARKFAGILAAALESLPGGSTS